MLGATRGMGRAVARVLAARGDDVCLLGRRPAELARSARDLRVRNALLAAPPVVECDLARPETFGPALDSATGVLGGLDAVIVTAAGFAAQTALEADADRARELAVIDFANTVASVSMPDSGCWRTAAVRCACSRRWRATAAGRRS